MLFTAGLSNTVRLASPEVNSGAGAWVPRQLNSYPKLVQARVECQALPNFFLVQTKPNAEDYAASFLKSDSFSIYLPKVRVAGIRQGRLCNLVRPFLARYLFIHNDGKRGPFYFRNAPGIASVVKTGISPVLVKRDVIEAMQKREVNGFIQLESACQVHAPLYRPGDRLRLTGNVMTGFDAIFQEQRNDSRAIVLISLMGRAAKIEVAIADLQHV